MYDDLREAVKDLNYQKSISLVESYMEEEKSAVNILAKLSEGLLIVGEFFERGEYFLSELMFAAEIMKECTSILEPKLIEETTNISKKGKVVIGTVEGDLHDIGKNIFITLLKASGFEVIDLGIDVSADKFIESIKIHEPDILGMSALLTTTAPEFKKVIDRITQEGLRDKVFIMIGGPQQEFAKEAGADIYCDNAFIGVSIALDYIGKRISSHSCA